MTLNQEKVRLLYVSKKKIKIGKNTYQLKIPRNCDKCFLLDRIKGCMFFKCGIKKNKVVPGGVCLPVKDIKDQKQYEEVITWIENNLMGK